MKRCSIECRQGPIRCRLMRPISKPPPVGTQPSFHRRSTLSISVSATTATRHRSCLLIPVVLIEDQLVAITDPYRGHRRMTLTRPALDGAGLIVWIVSGSDKAEMVERLIAGDTSIPAGLISQERAVLVTDAI